MSGEPNERRADSIDRVSELDYALPKTLIAQHPPERREDARLLVVDRASGRLRDASIVDLPQRLRPGDCLVLNNTKVLPARFTARRATGGAVRGLFLEENHFGVWCVMLNGSKRLRLGESLRLTADRGEPVSLCLQESLGEGRWRVAVEPAGTPERILDAHGQAPLPPYIHRDPHEPCTNSTDRARYQTVYAHVPGAVAAPTAGLHLTQRLLRQIAERGVEIAYVTLHVGVGTFKPIKVERLSEHVMHAETYELPEETAEAVRTCRRRGGRVVAVGTTSVRVLESAATESRTTSPSRGSTDLFIYPPYEFRVVDALLTNFHLPKSTLLALVMAFAGMETTRRAYAHAIERRYRFFSYGDAVWID